MDRSVVWAEIDSILASIDPNRASWVALLDSQIGPSDQLDGRASAAVLDFLVSLEDWASLNRLEDVVPAMVGHGFDCASFINGVVGEADLQDMGVKCSLTRRNFLTAAADLPLGIESVAASLSQSTTVETFLQRLCLQQHLARDFANLRHCLIDCLAGVTDSELRDKYQIRKLGHRRRVIRCLNRLPPSMLLHPQPQLNIPMVLKACSTKGISISISSSSSSGNLSSTTAERMQSAAATAAAPAAVASKSASMVGLDVSVEGSEPAGGRCRSVDSLRSAEAADIRTVRVEVSKARACFRPEVKPGWPHQPHILLGGSVVYPVSYLGFRPLENHINKTEIGQVMQNFRCKSVDILKLPQICLSVSYSGVKFVNPDTKMVITEHRVTDIYFACQDNTRRANFAYVTKDSSCGTHYCHCFASHSQEATVLIINTLSQACSLACQLIEFNQASRSIPAAAAVIKRRKPGGTGKGRMAPDVDHI